MVVLYKEGDRTKPNALASVLGCDAAGRHSHGCKQFLQWFFTKGLKLDL
jgi:hypothetical protein